MSRLTNSTRRFFLGGLGIATGALWLPSCGPGSEVRDLGHRLVWVIDRLDQWRLVGERYLEENPSERRLKALVDTLSRDLELDPELGSRQELAERLAALVRRDFTDGRTVMVDGWMLSETEARLAAVSFLL